LKLYPFYGSIQRPIFTITPQDPIWLGCHHVFDVVNEPSDKHRFSTACRSCNHTGKRMYPWHEMIRIVSVWNPRKTPDYWFSKYNRVLLHYSVSIAAAAATVAYIPLSAAAVYIPQSTAAAAYTPRSAVFRLLSRNTTVRTRT
jgi:hypothetical protein